MQVGQKGNRMNIDVTEEELKLLIQALTTSSISYIRKVADESNIELLGEGFNDWSMRLIEKSNTMTNLATKLQEVQDEN